MPGDFSLVVCDGPPGDTLGGRSGLLPVLGSHLRSDRVILLDDVGRPAEKALVEHWSQDSSVSFELCGVRKPFAICRLPHTHPPPATAGPGDGDPG